MEGWDGGLILYSDTKSFEFSLRDFFMGFIFDKVIGLSRRQRGVPAGRVHIDGQGTRACQSDISFWGRCGTRMRERSSEIDDKEDSPSSARRYL